MNKHELKNLNDKHKLNTLSSELDFYDQMVSFLSNLEANEHRYLEAQKFASNEYLSNIKTKRLRIEQIRKETIEERMKILKDQLGGVNGNS